MSRISEYIRAAGRAYKEEGLLPLCKKSLQLLSTQMSKLPLVNTIYYRLSVCRLYEQMSYERDASDVIDTVFSYQGFGMYRSIEPMQIRSELERLVEIVGNNKPSVVMEIGTADGGTFYVWSRAFESVEQVVSLDLPGGEFGGGYQRSKIKLFKQFTSNQAQIFVRGDSHSQEASGTIKSVVGDDGIDVLFIDGDHTYEGVKEDFERYRPFVNEGGLVVLHDIVHHPHDPECEVNEFWSELKQEMETTEIINSEDQNWGGIGIVHM